MSARKRIGFRAGLVACSRTQFLSDYGEHDYYFWLPREIPKATSFLLFVCTPVQFALDISSRECENQGNRPKL